MELVTAIGTEIGISSAATAAGAGATAADTAFMAHFAGAGAGASTGSSVFSLANLGTGLSLASMAASLFGGVQQGKAQVDALTRQAEQDMLSAKQEEVKGKQEANDITDALLQTIAKQRLAFSGAGLDPSFGTATSLADETRRIAEMQLSTSRDNAQNIVLSRRRQGLSRLEQRNSVSTNSLLTGIASAAGTASDMFDRRARRG